MEIPRKDRIPAHPVTEKKVLGKAPPRAILMTPLMSTVGALLVFFTVAVVTVVILPTFSMNPPPSDNWLPTSDQALRGRAVFLANGCVYCHSGFSRPQDYFNAPYYLYPRVSEPGDYWEGEPGPNILGTARTGPDLSQEGGQHPDGWHHAHYYSPRATTPISIMPRFNFFSDQELADMVAFNQSRGGKDALIRVTAIDIGNKLMRANMGMVDPAQQYSDLVNQLKQQGTYVENGQPTDSSPWGLPWKAVWMLNSFERGYWLTDDPLPLTQQNLLRGKTIFIERCVGCHGDKGDGAGVGAGYLIPPPFDFSSKDNMNNPFTSSGDLYHRILTAGPGTAMENFGTRLSVEDIWRVVLFLRTIANGSLSTKETLPAPDMWIKWEPPQPLLNYIRDHPIQTVSGIRQTEKDPFMAAAQWVAPGMAAGDSILIGGKLPMTLDRLAALIKSQYMSTVEQWYTEANNRGNPLPDKSKLTSTDGLTFHAP